MTCVCGENFCFLCRQSAPFSINPAPHSSSLPVKGPSDARLDTTATNEFMESREASEHGAIAHQCMPGPDARKRKRKVDQDAKASASASENNLPSNNNNQIQTPYGSGVSLYNDQMSVDTQHPRHRAQDLNVPGAMPPPPLPTQSGMPGERPAKKRKTDGSGTESDTTSTQSAPFWADPFAHYGA